MTTREQWLAERRTGIGSSDAAAAVGMSRWVTPLELYLDKRGELETAETEPMRWGTLLEPVVRQEYADRTGRVVRVPGGILRHPKTTFALLTADGITDDGRLYEGKTARTAEGWGEPGTGEIPLEYVCQVQHGMYVAGLAVADVAVLIGGQDFRVYTVDADLEFQALLMEREAAFWRRVQEGTPPDPVNAADVRRRWPVSTARQVIATAAVASAVEALRANKADAAAAGEAADRLAAEIQSFMGDAAELVCDGVTLATWKSAKPARRFDAKRFQAEHPDLYEQYVTEAPAQRRFLLKENGD